MNSETQYLFQAGFIDILINNAGIGIGGRVVDVAEDAIRKTVELNTLCHFWVSFSFFGPKNE